MAQGEGDDPLFQVRADLVGHPGSPALADVEGFQAPTVDALLPAVIRGAVDAHRPAGGRHVAQLVGQREQAQTESDEHVMLCHRLPPLVSQPGE